MTQEDIQAIVSGLREAMRLENSPWLTAKEAAARLRVSVKRIEKLRRDGVLKGGIVAGASQFRYHRDDVDRVVILPRRITR